MNWSLFGRLCGRTNRRPVRANQPRGNERPRRLRRGIRLEQLEGRALLAFGDLPFGAMPDDTGEYMLGDVRVNVVFMESDATMTRRGGAPADNGSITYQLPNNPPTTTTYNYTPENWSNWNPTALELLKGRIANGLAWWRETLHARFPKAPTDALNFTIDWTYAENPAHTAYEPIARISDDFSQWIYDFLGEVGFDQHRSTSGFSPDIRAFNNFTRQQTNSDWAFTIFVVNDLSDPNKRFTQFSNLGSFSQAFAFAGGQFMVVPASRPFDTFAHESGHMFWGLDEYLDVDLVFNPTTGQFEPGQIADEYLKRRGYYDTQNLNAADNPTAGFVQEDSIMSNGLPMQRARDNHTSSSHTLAMIGWKDADNDGIMDVLDVPLQLSGSGQYDINTGIYYFNGSTEVRTLPNRNSSGLQNDITINQIRAIEYSVDNGVTWQRHTQTFAPRTYTANISINFPVPDGQNTVKVRTVDTRTGVKSNEVIGYTDGPSPASPGVSGFVFRDDDGDGAWGAGEPPLPDYGIDVLDESGQPLDLLRWVEPDDANPLDVLSGDGATLTAVGFDTGSSKSVFAASTNLASYAGLVFGTTNSLNQTAATWNDGRKLRVDFGALQGNVSIHAYGGATADTFARLEAYSAGGTLLERVTSSALAPQDLRLLSLNRPTADISYVLVYGHAGTSVVFDTLEWGPASSATSDSLGAYSLNTLPDGTYQVQVIPPSPSHTITTPLDGVGTVTILGGQSSGNVDFGIHIAASGFHNSENPLNVDADLQGAVSPVDAVMVINWLNAHAGQSTIPPGSDPLEIGYIDVDNDGLCSPIDAVLVINYLISNFAGAQAAGSGGEGPTGESSGAETTAAAGSQAEGETALALAAVQAAAETTTERKEHAGPPRTAAEYFARNPIHFEEIPGTDLPCSCAQCLAVQGGPTTGQRELQSAVEAIAAEISLAADESLPRIARRLLTGNCQ
jgi:hypothetical protein